MEREDVILQDTEEAPKKKKRGLWKLIVVVVLLISLTGNAILFLRYREQKANAAKMEAYYSELYFHFDSLTVDSFKEKVASGEEFVVLVSRPNCPNCKRLEQPFVEFAQQQGIEDKIYLLNVVILRQNAEVWAEFKDTYGFEGTPTYIRFSGGKNVSCIGWTYEKNIEIEMVEDWIAQQRDYFGV